MTDYRIPPTTNLWTDDDASLMEPFVTLSDLKSFLAASPAQPTPQPAHAPVQPQSSASTSDYPKPPVAAQSVEPFNQEMLMQRLQALIKGARESWTYAIFWQSSYDYSGAAVLGWGEGFYKDERDKVKAKAKTTTSAAEQEYRKKVLRDLNSLISGADTSADDDVVDQDVTDTEWFFLVSMTQSFVNGGGLPGQAFFYSTPVWVAGPDRLAASPCERGRQGQVFGLQTMVCVPTAYGVVELGSTELIYQSSDLMNKGRVLFDFNNLEMRLHEEHSNLDEDYSSDNIIEADDENGQVKEKKGRGYNKRTWGKSGKECIEFTKDGLCLMPKDAKLSRFLGSLARTSNLLPLKPQDWRVLDNKDNTVEEVWRIIYNTIDWQPKDIPNVPIIRLKLLNKVATRWRNYKATLKEKYYTPYVGMPKRFTCGDHRVDQIQWKAMVDYWDNDPKNKIKVEVNVNNRKKQKINHTGGTKSFARHMVDFEEKHGRKPDPIDIFSMVHRRRDKKKSWVDNASEQMAGKISQELAQLVAANGEETPELRQKAYVTAIGFEKHDRVRGYGAGVTPDMVPWVVQTQPASSSRRQSRKGRDYAHLESQFLQLQANYAQQREESQQDRNEVQNLKQVISSLEQRLRPHSQHESSSSQ